MLVPCSYPEVRPVLDDRPRERLFRYGPRQLTDVELVALVLRNGRGGQSALELARDLVARHRDVRALAAQPAVALADYAGMGPAKAAAVAAAFELGRRSVEADEAVPLRRAEDVVAVARREQRGMPRDELLVFVTDVASRVRWTVSAGTGALRRLAAPVGRAIDAVVGHDGAGFAVARLSSDRSAAVTPADEELLRRFRAAACYAGVRFHDYVVVADSDWCGVRVPVPYEAEPASAFPTMPARASPG
jgi:DNA repair protein RadC